MRLFPALCLAALIAVGAGGFARAAVADPSPTLPPAATAALSAAMAQRSNAPAALARVQVDPPPLGLGGNVRLPLDSAKTSEAVRTALLLTLLALIPAVAICMTPFIRFVVVLSMIRHAFGMPETPPSQVLISLAIFLTAFTMGPTLSAVNSGALQPFMSGQLTVEEAIARGSEPMKQFMLRQVQDEDIKAVYDISRQPLPERASEVGIAPLTTAFMLNELRVSFKIGFVILLPFLLIDLVVAGILLALGMMMVPPSTISLPIKVLMFVLINGWTLVLQGVVGSFH